MIEHEQFRESVGEAFAFACTCASCNIVNFVLIVLATHLAIRQLQLKLRAMVMFSLRLNVESTRLSTGMTKNSPPHLSRRVSNPKSENMRNEFISVFLSRSTLGIIKTTPQIG